MSAYVIVQVDVHDPDRYESYKSMVPPTLGAFGGRFLVRGGEIETLEGDWAPARLVVIEFPDSDRARQWLESESYRAARELRHATARTQMIVADGVQ